jgi:NAD(P)-dependent dehydrogenase (short-subunit alcohol dehydrogenase family)
MRGETQSRESCMGLAVTSGKIRMMKRLEGKGAVVVGGSSGFGRSIAERFVAEGARVLIAARGREKLEAAAEELGVEARVCDASRFDDLKALAAAAVEQLGRLDIAVNCAGFEHMCPIAELEPEHVEEMVAVQFTGALYFIQHMANAMADGGSIVTISSLTGTLVADGYAPYAGAKAGINHASRIAASEYGPRKIRVNVVSPTTVETPMVAKLFQIPGVREAFEKETPMGELPGVEDVTEAVLFLASDGSRFVSGENIHVDGGGSTRRLPRNEDVVAAMQAAAAKANGET